MAITSTRENLVQSIVVSGSEMQVPSTRSFRSITEGISIDDSVRRKISRAICFEEDIAPPSSRLLENIRIQNVRGTLAPKHRDDVIGGHYGHFCARLDRGRGDVRGQHDVGALESGMNEGLVLENIQGCTGDFVVF